MAQARQHWLTGLYTDLGVWLLVPLIVAVWFIVNPFLIIRNLVQRARYRPLADDQVQEAGNQILAGICKELHKHGDIKRSER